MKRPLADKRPVGPFAQSGNFSEAFDLSGSSKTFERGEEYIIKINQGSGTTTSFGEYFDALSYFFEDEISDFVNFTVVADGSISADRNNSSYILETVVEDVSDNDVTVEQINESVIQFLRKEDFNVTDMDMYKSV